MGLLEEIKQNRVIHPLKEESLELKAEYLKGVAYFLAIDENITDDEKAKFDELIGFLDCEDIREDLFTFLQKPEASEFDATLKAIREKRYVFVYLSELFYISSKDTLSKEEEEFVKMVSKVFQVTEAEMSFVATFIKSIKTESHDRLIRQIKEMLEDDTISLQLKKLVKFYRLDNSVRAELLKEYNAKHDKVMKEGMAIFKEKAKILTFAGDIISITRKMLKAGDWEYSRLESKKEKLEKRQEKIDRELEKREKSNNKEQERINEILDIID